VTKPIDLAKDWLANAALAPEQREIWNAIRAELGTARIKIQDLQTQIRLLERQPIEEPHSILTRPEFNREVARMLAFDQRYGGTSSVLYFDFEKLNDVSGQYGKSVANAAIRQIGDTLLKNVRGSDVIGRLAPDEFGVLLMRCDNASAWRKGEQLASSLYEATVEVHGCKLDVAISYGAYTFRDDEDLATGLKEAAHAVTRAHKPL
jgi:diguanylate cyclase (GGDEF)-like protein